MYSTADLGPDHPAGTNLAPLRRIFQQPRLLKQREGGIPAVADNMNEKVTFTQNIGPGLLEWG